MAKSASTIGKSNVRRSKAHERWVAQLLTDWSGTLFRRRRAEGRGPAVVEVEGAADVIAVGAELKFSIEAKCGKGFSFNSLLGDPQHTMFTSWWHQATYDAGLMSQARGWPIYPMLFFRPYNGSNWIAIPEETIKLCWGTFKFPHVIYRGYSNYGPITCDVSHSPKTKQLVALDLTDVVMCRCHDWVANVDPLPIFRS